MTNECIERLTQAGIEYADAVALRRIAMTLSRWHELECGAGNDYASWTITRGRKENGEFVHDEDGDAYEERHIHTENKARYTRIPDRERGALKRLYKIMDRYSGYSYYVQTDPRGASLYISNEPGMTGENYSARGIAVYK